jgi:hypothetical protein
MANDYTAESLEGLVGLALALFVLYGVWQWWHAPPPKSAWAAEASALNADPPRGAWVGGPNVIDGIVRDYPR